MDGSRHEQEVSLTATVEARTPEDAPRRAVLPAPRGPAAPRSVSG